MFKKLKNLTLTLVSAGFVLMPVMVPAVAHAQSTPGTPQIQNCLASGANLNVKDCSSTSTTDTNGVDLNSIISKIINILSLIVGAVAVIMIIVGGLRYVTSGGSDSSVASAKNTIIYALIGLVIVALAQVIVHFVLNKLTSSS